MCLGLQYSVAPSCGPIPYLYMDRTVDFSIRAKAIASMKTVFRDALAYLSDGDIQYCRR